MEITTRSWQKGYDSSIYKPSHKEHSKAEKDTMAKSQSEEDNQSSSINALTNQASDSSKSGFKMKSSMPDDSVGELAAMLARAETRMDVQQVYSKAMRALTSLKMSSVASEGNNAKKIAQMIKRMEKLIKRIRKKLQHLNKEEQLERQRKKAEKKMERPKALQLQNELRSRRRKRRRDEQNYALKELAEDGKTALNDTVSAMISAGSSPSFSELPAMGTDSGTMCSSLVDSGSFDMMV
ncbi:hypothetical protein AALB16_10835 [Lachnospiraceae bacterium 62-35]